MVYHYHPIVSLTEFEIFIFLNFGKRGLYSIAINQRVPSRCTECVKSKNIINSINNSLQINLKNQQNFIN